MYSLKPQKTKPAGTNSNSNANTNKDKDKDKPKGQSKKIAKTVFEDPFHYRIQLLPQQEASQAQALFIAYLNKIRESMPYKQPRVGLTKTIKFQQSKNIKKRLTPIVSNKIAIGIKASKKALYRSWKAQQKQGLIAQLTLIFYEQNKSQQLMELLCLLKTLNAPYLVMRQSGEISRALGVRTVGSVCLFEQQFANSLLKYIGKCMVEIPWLIQMSSYLHPVSTSQSKQMQPQK